jgi:hypothetical protein
MIKKIVPSLLWLICLAPVHAQVSAAAEQAAPSITRTGSDLWDLSWYGLSGRTYFMQSSASLQLWDYMPMIELGENASLSQNVSPLLPGSRFYRLRFSDTPTTQPAAADFDGDGVPNQLELTLTLSDPLVATPGLDTDNDTLPDAWEISFFGTTTTQSGTGDPDSDGLTNREELDLLLNPNVNESTSSAAGGSYLYDANGRLISASAPELSTTFTHDEEGSILSAQ